MFNDTLDQSMGKRNSSVSSRGSSFYAPSADGHKSKKKDHDVKQPKIGADIYKKFEQQVGELDKELRKLSNKARKLGSSAGILSASTRLRERLGRVLHLFRQNARDLYTEEIQAHMVAHPAPLKPVRRWKAKNFLDRTKHTQMSPSTDTKYENLALEFRLFSRDVMTLFDCFSQFPQFVEELPDWSLAEDLQIWANSLDNFEHEFATLAVQKYLYDSMADIGNHMEALATRFIPTFTKLGIPAVRASQDRGTENLENQTIVAALFAGIATGMLQIYSDPPADAAIIMLWNMCLIFSISSAVNGLLGLSWAQAIYRSPDQQVPWWILIWIKRFPLVFLVLAVACSFVALILIALIPQQSGATFIVTIILAAFACFGLLAVSGWFACELLVFVHYQGRVWLLDAIKDMRDRMTAFILMCWLRIRAGGKDIINYRPLAAKTDIEQVDLSTVPVNIGFQRRTPQRADSNVSFWLTMDKDALEHSTRIKHRWHEAVRRVIESQRESTGRSAPRRSSRFAHLTNVAVNSQIVTKMQSMTISLAHHINEKHTTLVRSLQFSPDGKYLVTSSWDSQTFLFRINTPVLCERELTYPVNTGYVHQVDWSPDGNKLLMRSNKKLIVWQLDPGDQDGNGIRQAEIIVRYSPEESDQTIRSASWRVIAVLMKPTVTAFFAVLGKRVLTMDTTGEILRNYPTQHLELRDVCVTKDSCWMICVGKYLPQEEQRPAQKYGIIVWDLKNHKVAKKVPVYYDMSNVTLASDDRSVLVSYENRSPSQFWQLLPDAANTDFILRHSYLPKENVSFAALPSIFGGDHDHLVLRAAIGKYPTTPSSSYFTNNSAGDIYVWDRDSAAFVHHIRPPPILEGRFTSFAWNRGSESYMFATGTHDGTIHIWAPESDLEPGKGKREYAASAFDGTTVVASRSSVLG
ncbi:hypothetical protein BC629DRAFT_1600734 [Irpex lacteus]|nr:hypothetical protein BC629DRAFT_1600734 [Irpex lacteus]